MLFHILPMLLHVKENNSVTICFKSFSFLSIIFLHQLLVLPPLSLLPFILSEMANLSSPKKMPSFYILLLISLVATASLLFICSAEQLPLHKLIYLSTAGTYVSY